MKVRVRADELDDELLAIMVDAGVEIIQFGVENISSDIRKSMYKNINNRQIDHAFNAILKRPKLFANPTYMLTYPGESWNDFETNAEFIKSAGANDSVITYVSFTTPYPGTKFYGEATNKGIILTKDLRFYTNKFPVYIPNTMLNVPVMEALNRLKQVYYDISYVVNKYNKTQFPISDDFFKAIDIDKVSMQEVE